MYRIWKNKRTAQTRLCYVLGLLSFCQWTRKYFFLHFAVKIDIYKMDE